MSIILDLIIIAVLVIFAVIGIKRGAIKEIVSLVGIIVALILAYSLSKPVSAYIYDNFVSEAITTTISDTVVETVGDNTDAFILKLPEEVVKAADTLGVELDNVLVDASTAEEIAAVINSKVARPLILRLVEIIVFIVIFILSKILIGFIGKVLNIVAKLPVISSANKLVGGVVGLIRGLIFVLIACYAVIISLDFNPDGFFGITADTVKDTFVFNFISGLFK